MTTTNTPPTPEERTIQAARRLRTWLDVPQPAIRIGAAIPPRDAPANEWGKPLKDIRFDVPDDPISYRDAVFATVGNLAAAGPEATASSPSDRSKKPPEQSGA
jgi:hypothetical protein